MIYIVGIGPGAAEHMTFAARNAIENADVIVGYTGYMEFVGELAAGKRTVSTPMMREVERCRAALGFAAGGERVAMICSGDAGVYGMAGLIYELSAEYPAVEIEIIPGVTAALSGAAVLGAPLGHDFAVISLSDLLTPWELIENRLEYAALGDFCVALYNPASKKRGDYLQRACDILLRHKPDGTVCGYVRNIGRDGEESKLLALSELRGAVLDMFCTAFVGNSATRNIGGKMVTPRGYRNV